MPDLQEYKRNRGFYLDIEKWHFPYAETEDELRKLIAERDSIDWKHEMECHHLELGSHETGQAAENVIKYIKEQNSRRKIR